MRKHATAVSVVLLGMLAGYYCYGLFGDRYWYFERPGFTKARFDNLTGTLRHMGRVRLETYRTELVPVNEEWGEISPDDEILIATKTGRPVMAFSRAYASAKEHWKALNRTAQFREQRDVVTGKVQYVSVDDSSIVVRPWEDQYRWESAGAYWKKPGVVEQKVYDFEPGFVFVRFP